MSAPKQLLSALVALAVAASALLAHPAIAAPTLEEVQAKVRQLEEDATTAAEGAQEAKVKLAILTKTLNGIMAKAQAQGQSLSVIQKSRCHCSGAVQIREHESGFRASLLERSNALPLICRQLRCRHSQAIGATSKV